MAPIAIVFFLAFISFGGGRAQPKQSSHIGPGSSLSPTTQPSSWLSLSNRFAFGFYQLQDTTGFAVGIWLIGKHNKTVVWAAPNRDDPLITSNTTLEFSTEGMLILKSERGQQNLIANEICSVSYATMLDSGNFVLYDKDSKKVWQSFEHPTDTILGVQTLFAGAQLTSTGSRLHLRMQDDGNLVLYPINTGDTPEDAYWSSNTYFGKDWKNFDLYLNNTGRLHIINRISSNLV